MDRRITLILLCIACSGPATSEPINEPIDTTGDERPAQELSEVQQWNARAREGAVTETLHGVEVPDPYRALESESAMTTEWVNAQTARADAALERWAVAGMRERLDALLQIGSIDGPAQAGNRLFYTKRDGTREQPALYVRDGDRLRDAPIIDPLTYGERAALDWYYPSPGGRYVAFGISSSGDERSTLRVYDVNENRVLDDTLDHAKWSAATWLHSETGFYYRRYPRPGEPNYDAEHEDAYHMRLFFHRLGAPTAEDVLVYAPAEPTDFPSASVSDDDRWLVINNFRGWSQSEVFLFDRGANRRGRLDAPTAERAVVPIVTGQDHLYTAWVHRGRFYVSTNDGAPRYRVAAAAPAEAADRARWTDVIPESEGSIENVEIVGDRIVVHTIENIASRVRVFRLDGRPDGEIALPGRGELFGFDGDEESGRLAIGFSSFVHPPALFTWSTRQRELREVDRVQTDFDWSAVELSQVNVPSRDGTPINVYYMHRRDMPRDGQNRVLINGYGGFNVSLLPGFQRNALYWVERGGVYAVANLRGGGEFGEEWHRAGNLANKERVFEDMEAVINWFGMEENGISTPLSIAITGGSNGGLLMGAMITRNTARFRVAVSNVGLYDMVRYHHFPPAEVWITEYGSADDADQFRFLHAYSPYHHVVDGTEYPAVFVTTADHDSRVHWAHSTKFAARLQEATGSADPDIYFHMVREQGHGAGTRRSDTVDRYVRLYTFIEHYLGGHR